MISSETLYKKDTPKQIDDDLVALKKLNTAVGSEIRVEQKLKILEEKVSNLTATLIAENISNFEEMVTEIAELEKAIPVQVEVTEVSQELSPKEKHDQELGQELQRIKTKLKQIVRIGILSEVKELTHVANQFHLKQETIHADSALERWRKARFLNKAARNASLFTDIENKHATNILTFSWISQLFLQASKYDKVKQKDGSSISPDDVKKVFSDDERAERRIAQFQAGTRPVFDPSKIPTGSTKPIPQT